MNADEVRRGWATRSTEYSPGYYAYYGPNETSERVRRTLDRLVGSDAAVLELGCSAGRHLRHLHEHGYGSLAGVDINDEAAGVMAATYPDLAATVAFHHGAIERVVPGFDDGQFDAVFSVETLQHLHPDDAWVFAEVARVTDDVLVTVENETPTVGGETVEDRDGTPVSYVNDEFPLYHRDWGALFATLGLVEVATEDVSGRTLRAFRWA